MRNFNPRRGIETGARVQRRQRRLQQGAAAVISVGIRAYGPRHFSLTKNLAGANLLYVLSMFCCYNTVPLEYVIVVHMPSRYF